MGTEVPPGWPEIDPAKWYCVTEVAYVGAVGVQACVGGIYGTTRCCRAGIDIIAFLAAGSQCNWFVFLCPVHWPKPKKLISVFGPFDTEVACNLVC